MPQYLYKCFECNHKFHSIEKINTELSYCPICDKLAKRVHGRDLPSPAQIEAGIGGVYKPRWGKKRQE